MIVKYVVNFLDFSSSCTDKGLINIETKLIDIFSFFKGVTYSF